MADETRLQPHEGSSETTLALIDPESIRQASTPRGFV